MPRLKLALSRFAPALAAGGLSCALTLLLGAISTASAADGPRWLDLSPLAAPSPGSVARAKSPQDPAAPAGRKRKDGHDHYEIDSEHIFGFTHGTDIGEKGEIELELEPVAAIGKRFGTYFATSQLAAIKYSVTDSFRIAPEVVAATHDIWDNPDFENRRQAGVMAASLEMRYRIFDRETGPFGLTLNFDPGWSRIDELTAERVIQYGGEFGIFIDKALIPDRLFGAINFNYALGATRLKATGEWSRDSAVEIDVSLTNHIAHGVFVGAEARYLQQYEGLGLDRLKGEALYVGPTFFVKLGKSAGLSGAWNFQVAGKPVEESGALDLVNFERQQVLLRFNALLDPD